MSLGGGTFTSQNKVLPGAYYNVISAARASSSLGERGVVALPIALQWGNAGVLTVTAEDFQKDSLALLGYAYDAAELAPIRDVFKNAQKIHIFNLAGTGAAAASCNYCTAKKAGTRGNTMQIVIQKNIDVDTMFDVSLYFGGTVVFEQTVANIADLSENDYVTWSGQALSVTAGLPLSGGTDGTVDTSSYQKAINALESYNFNVLIAPVAAIDLYVAFTKRMRDQVGVKFQTVIPEVTNPDYFGVVQIPEEQAAAVYWVGGALAGCAINKSNTNKLYDGEGVVTCDHTQSELEDCIKTGVFVLHKVEDEIRVLTDINSFVSFTQDTNDLFASNQTVRVVDQCANDDARAFNKYFLGKVQNDQSGRMTFWNDIVTRRQEMAEMRAIETFATDLLTVDAGKGKGDVVVHNAITIIGTMEKLYMTTEIN